MSPNSAFLDGRDVSASSPPNCHCEEISSTPWHSAAGWGCVFVSWINRHKQSVRLTLKNDWDSAFAQLFQTFTFIGWMCEILDVWSGMPGYLITELPTASLAKIRQSGQDEHKLTLPCWKKQRLGSVSRHDILRFDVVVFTFLHEAMALFCASFAFFSR